MRFRHEVVAIVDVVGGGGTGSSTGWRWRRWQMAFGRRLEKWWVACGGSGGKGGGEARDCLDEGTDVVGL